MSDLQWDKDFAMEQTGGDEELLAELLVLFRDSSADDYRELCKAIENGNMEGVVTAAHSIKGASSSLGFEGISTLAMEMEKAARAGSIEPALTGREAHREPAGHSG
jgi:HPt (histidine-containing phosphotransfer) domain-containing protein